MNRRLLIVSASLLTVIACGTLLLQLRGLGRGAGPTNSPSNPTQSGASSPQPLDSGRGPLLASLHSPVMERVSIIEDDRDIAAPPSQNAQTKTAAVKKPAAPKAPEAPAVSAATISVNGITDIDPAKAFGSKTAPVVVEIYSDFQCPACKQLFLNTTQKVMDNYVNTGKVYLVHRDFPLPMHAYSRVAASYSRAAAHIGKCEAVETALFQNQEKWETNGDVKGIVAGVLSPAEMKKVQAIVDAKTLEPMIDKDKQIGLTLPVTQTPTSVFHSKGQTYPYAGTLSYDVLKDFLDQLIARK